MASFVVCGCCNGGVVWGRVPTSFSPEPGTGLERQPNSNDTSAAAALFSSGGHLTVMRFCCGTGPVESPRAARS